MIDEKIQSAVGYRFIHPETRAAFLTTLKLEIINLEGLSDETVQVNAFDKYVTSHGVRCDFVRTEGLHHPVENGHVEKGNLPFIVGLMLKKAVSDEAFARNTLYGFQWF